MQNFIFYWGPLLPFWDIFRNLDKFRRLNNFWFFSVQNLGHTRTNCTVFLVMGVKMSKKWMSALVFFFHAPKPKPYPIVAVTHVLIKSLCHWWKLGWVEKWTSFEFHDDRTELLLLGMTLSIGAGGWLTVIKRGIISEFHTKQTLRHQNLIMIFFDFWDPVTF